MEKSRNSTSNIIFCFLLPLLIGFSDTVVAGNRIVARMVHYNSVDSPYFDPNATNRDMEISLARLDDLKLGLQGGGRTRIITRPALVPVFLVYLRVGNPPQDQAVIMDTGSSLFWIHCAPNADKNGVYLIFDPLQSKSYNREFLCDAYCDKTILNCVQYSTLCYYQLNYLGGNSSGFMARESIILESVYDNTSTIDNVVFGCSRKTPSDMGRYNGVLGLGILKYSLVSQVADRNLGPKKFSYCIGNLSDPFYTDNVLFIGEDIKFVGQTAPLYLQGSHYAVNIEGISFNSALLDIGKNSLWRSDGGTIIDSGSSVSFLQSIAYYALEDAIMDFIGDRMDRSDVTSDLGIVRLCFMGNLYRDFTDFPMVTFHFEGGATMNIARDSLFTLLHPELTCLNVVDSFQKRLEYSVLAVGLQQYHYVSFDVLNKQVGFRRMDCRELRHVCLTCG